MTQFSSTLQKCAIFGLELFFQLAIASAKQNVRLNAEPGQLLHAVLRRFGLELAGGRDKRHQRQMHVQNIFAAEVPAELAHRFEERQALDIADRPADFDDDQIRAFGRGEDAPLDLVGDMRNHLHRRAEVIAAPFLLDDGVVDLAGGAVVALAHRRLHEALVMAEVEIGLRAVVGDEHFAMLRRTHRAGIHIDVGIHLEHRDLEPARLEQRAERRGGQALAERRDHAAGYENKFCFSPLHAESLPILNELTPKPSRGRAQGRPRYLLQATAPPT